MGQTIYMAMPLALTAARCQQAATDRGGDETAWSTNSRRARPTSSMPAQWAKLDAQRAKDVAVKATKKPNVRVLSLTEMKQRRGSGPAADVQQPGR